MKRLLLVIALLAGLVTTAAAQDVQYNGSTYINRRTGNMVDANGNVYVTTPVYDTNIHYGSIIADTSATASAQDSSYFYDVHSASRLWLKIKWNPAAAPSNAASFARVAVSIRCAWTSPTSTDTMTVAPWQPCPRFPTATTDSTGNMSYNTGLIGSTGVLATQDEIVIQINKRLVANAVTDQSNAVWIPLADNRGVFLWAPWISVKVRPLAATASPGTYTVDIDGTTVR